MPAVIGNRKWQPMLPSEVDATKLIVLAMRSAHLPGWPDCQILTNVRFPAPQNISGARDSDVVGINRWVWVQLAPPFDAFAKCQAESWDLAELAIMDKMQKGYRVHACRNIDEMHDELERFANADHSE